MHKEGIESLGCFIHSQVSTSFMVVLMMCIHMYVCIILCRMNRPTNKSKHVAFKLYKY